MIDISGKNDLIVEESTYNEIANEYYDFEKHPTCGAFDELTTTFLESYFGALDIKKKTICEVGAGRSKVAQVLSSNLDHLSSICLMDSSAKMLDWSKLSVHPKIEYQISEASDMHRFGNKYDIIVANLGDPYNTLDFWQSVSKALASDGRCVFTTPSYRWSDSFRKSSSREIENRALFELADGSSYFVPSFVYDRANQEQMFQKASLKLISYQPLSVDMLKIIPSKIKHLKLSDPLIECYELERQ